MLKMDLQVSFVVLVVGNISDVLWPWNRKGLGTNRRTINNYFCNLVSDLTTRKCRINFSKQFCFVFKAKKIGCNSMNCRFIDSWKTTSIKKNALRKPMRTKMKTLKIISRNIVDIPYRRQKKMMVLKLKRTRWWCARCGMCNCYLFISYCCYFILFCHVSKLLVVSLF